MPFCNNMNSTMLLTTLPNIYMSCLFKVLETDAKKILIAQKYAFIKNPQFLPNHN